MKLTLLFVLTIVGFPALSQENKSFKIYDTKLQKEVDFDEMLNSISSSNAVFFGEEHNDPTGHKLEEMILKGLHQRNNRNQVLSLEMFESDVQLVLDEYLKGLIQEKNFIKDSRAWNNYADYRPMVEYAKEHKFDVIAANTPKRYVNLVSRKGLSALSELDKASRKWLPALPVDTASGRYYDKFLESLGGHNMPGMQIYQSQNLWDAGMAFSMYQYLRKNKNSKIFQVNGRFHSDEHLGAAAKFKIYSKKSRVSVISSFSDQQFNEPDWQKFSSLGDFVIITDPNLKRTY